MADSLLRKLDLDDVLVKFKLNGRYHTTTIVYLTLLLLIDFEWYCSHIFVVQKVEYRCIKYNPSPETVNCSSSNSNTTTASCMNSDMCAEWLYEDPSSFVAEFQLACQEWKRTTVGSISLFGYMVGLPIIGSLSDRFGRKTMVIITSIITGIMGCLKSFASSYWLFVALEFLEAACDPMSPAYMLSVEFVATKSRVAYTTICMTGLGMGGILLALTAWLVPYWRTMLKVLYAPGFLGIFFIYLLDESPRWLLANGKKDEAVKIITKAAKLNKMEIENLSNISHVSDKGPSFGTVMKDTIKSSSLMKRVFVCSTWWIAGTFVNFGMLVNSTLLGGSKYLNFGLSSAMKCLGIVISAFIIKKFNRRGPLISTFLACAILCTVQPFLPKNLFLLQIFTYMIGFLLSCSSLCIIYIFTSELFPTQSRNSLHALCSAVGRIGTIIAPQTPLLIVYWSGLPILIFGVVSLTAGLVTFLVPDTAGQALPDTVGQAEEMEVKARDRRLTTL